MSLEPSLFFLSLWTALSIYLSLAVRTSLKGRILRFVWTSERNVQPKSSRVLSVSQDFDMAENASVMAYNAANALRPTALAFFFWIGLFALGAVIGGVYLPSFFTGAGDDGLVFAVLLWVAGAAWGWLFTLFTAYALKFFLVVVGLSFSLYLVSPFSFYHPDQIVVNALFSEKESFGRAHFETNYCVNKSVFFRSNIGCIDRAKTLAQFQEFGGIYSSTITCKGVTFDFGFFLSLNEYGSFTSMVRFTGKPPTNNWLFSTRDGYAKNENMEGFTRDWKAKTIEYKSSASSKMDGLSINDVNLLFDFSDVRKDGGGVATIDFINPSCGKQKMKRI